ncbi:MAG: universal stress protein [Nitrospirae bacterium]|nr:MAG: universal stress protein [Nitrospirota bacterium]
MPSSKKILVAVDNFDNSRKALTYVAEMVRGRDDAQVRVFHIIVPIPPELREHGGSEDPAKEAQLSRELQAAQSRWIEAQQQAFAPTLQAITAYLVNHGVPPQSISSESCACVQEANLDICLLEAAAAWDAGTLVVGWDTFSSFEEAMKRHLAEKLIRKGQGLTFWIVK